MMVLPDNIELIEAEKSYEQGNFTSALVHLRRYYDLSTQSQRRSGSGRPYLVWSSARQLHAQILIEMDEFGQAYRLALECLVLAELRVMSDWVYAGCPASNGWPHSTVAQLAVLSRLLGADDQLAEALNVAVSHGDDDWTHDWPDSKPAIEIEELSKRASEIEMSPESFFDVISECKLVITDNQKPLYIPWARDLQPIFDCLARCCKATKRQSEASAWETLSGKTAQA